MSRKGKSIISALWGVVALELLIIGIIFIFGKVSTKVIDIIGVPDTPTPTVGIVIDESMGIVSGLSAGGVDETSMTVIFDALEAAKGYEVCYRASGTEAWTVMLSASTEYSFEVSPETNYEVRVRGYSRSGSYGNYCDVVTIYGKKKDVVPIYVTVDKTTISSISLSWNESNPGETYQIRYRKDGTSKWELAEATTTSITLGGLSNDSNYDISVAATEGEQNTVTADKVTAKTGGDASVDPFLNLYATLEVSGSKKGVLMSDANGCLGAKVWAQFNTAIYEDSKRSGNTVSNLSGGTAMTISKSEDGSYAVRISQNDWSIHVEGTIGDKKVSGWVMASTMLIDLQDLFPRDNKYSIHYNRTNAYSSIFTAGGNALMVDSSSAEATRYDPLLAQDNAASVRVGGYNVIAGITGKKLPNYGSKDQMPAVWDLALELITCQRNALANGTCLLIYESYRPNSTSKAVNSAVSGNKYLTTSKNGHTFANGFFTSSNYSEGNYIAVNSRHNKGIALDLTIMGYENVDQLGEEIRMQTKMHTLDYRCNMAFNTDDANLLNTIMTTGTDLIPLRGKQEWWHFEMSGDSAKYPCWDKYIFADYEL